MAAAQVAREELSVLVALWDSVRDAPDDAKETVGRLISMCKWTTIIRLQLLLRSWVRRIRERIRARANGAS